MAGASGRNVSESFPLSWSIYRKPPTSIILEPAENYSLIKIIQTLIFIYTHDHSQQVYIYVVLTDNHYAIHIELSEL